MIRNKIIRVFLGLSLVISQGMHADPWSWMTNIPDTLATYAHKAMNYMGTISLKKMDTWFTIATIAGSALVMAAIVKGYADKERDSQELLKCIEQQINYVQVEIGKSTGKKKKKPTTEMKELHAKIAELSPGLDEYEIDSEEYIEVLKKLQEGLKSTKINS
jgi:hypothetical protein